MQPFTFDVTTLSPAPGLSHGVVFSPRPRGRFEVHLGQATSPPRQSSPETESRQLQPEPADARTSELSDTDASATYDAADKDHSQTAEEDRKEVDGSAQEATAAAAEKPATAQSSPDDTDAEDTFESNDKNGAGSPPKSKRRFAQAAPPADSDSSSLQQTARNIGNEALENPAAAMVVAEDLSEQGVADEAQAGRPGIVSALGQEQIDDGSGNALTSVGAVAATQAAAVTDAPANKQSDSPIGVQPAENAEKTEPTVGKRHRTAKAAAMNDATESHGESAAQALRPNTAAPEAGEVQEAAEFVAPIDASADNGAAGDGAPFSGGNDSADLRPGVGSNSPAVRQERPSESAARSEGLTEAERVRFVQRVARAFHSMGDEGGEVRLRLSPPELGSLRLEVSVRDGVLSARLEAETASARSLLLDNLPALRERLAEQNIKVERFDVDVRDEQRQPSREHLPGQPDVPQQGQRDRPRDHVARRATTIAQVTSRGGIRNDSAGELNIVI